MYGTCEDGGVEDVPHIHDSMSRRDIAWDKRCQHDDIFEWWVGGEEDLVDSDSVTEVSWLAI